MHALHRLCQALSGQCWIRWGSNQVLQTPSTTDIAVLAKRMPKSIAVSDAEAQLQAKAGMHHEERHYGRPQVCMSGPKAPIILVEEKAQHALQQEQPQSPKPRGDMRAAAHQQHNSPLDMAWHGLAWHCTDQLYAFFECLRASTMDLIEVQ